MSCGMSAIYWTSKTVGTAEETTSRIGQKEEQLQGRSKQASANPTGQPGGNWAQWLGLYHLALFSVDVGFPGEAVSQEQR